MKNTVELEQAILKSWEIIQDLENIFHYICDDPKFKHLSAEHEDEIANILLGLKTIYDIRFEKLWKEFEKALKEK